MYKKIKKYSFAMLLLASTQVFSQVGIGTQNPQGIFHIDASKDNPTAGAPSATQAANDVIVTATGNMGIGIINPGSSLSINGSLGTNYNNITNSTYTITNTDYYINYEGTANGTITLPIGSSATCNCEGRNYVISNPSNFTVTINAVAGETISGSNSILIDPSQTISIVNTNTASGVTWKIITYGSTKSPTSSFQIFGSDANGKINASPQNINTTYTNIDTSQLSVTVPTGYSNTRVVLRWSIWGDVGLNTTAASGSLRYRLRQVINGVTTFVEGLMYISWNAIAGLNVIRFVGAPSIVLNNLSPGTYTFSIDAIRIDETGTFSSPSVYGVAAKSDILVKN